MPFPTQKAQLFPPSRLLLWTEGESNSETLTVQTQARSAEFFRGIWLLLNLSCYDRIDSLCFSSLKLQRNWNRNVDELNNVAWITPSRVQFLQKMKASGATWASQSSAKSLQLLRSPVAVPLGFRDGSIHIGPSLRYFTGYLGASVQLSPFNRLCLLSVIYIFIYTRCLEKMFHINWDLLSDGWQDIHEATLRSLSGHSQAFAAFFTYRNCHALLHIFVCPWSSVHAASNWKPRTGYCPIAYSCHVSYMFRSSWWTIFLLTFAETCRLLRGKAQPQGHENHFPLNSLHRIKSMQHEITTLNTVMCQKW